MPYLVPAPRSLLSAPRQFLHGWRSAEPARSRLQPHASASPPSCCFAPRASSRRRYADEGASDAARIRRTRMAVVRGLDRVARIHDGSISTLFVATTPIFTACYDAVVLRRGLSLRSFLAFAGGAAGLAMVVAFNRTAPPHPGREWLGIALATGGSIAIAGYFILVREVRDALGTRTIVTHTYTWAALALSQPRPSRIKLRRRSRVRRMGRHRCDGADLATARPHRAERRLRWFSPSAISFSTLLEPIIAAVLALFIFDEALSPLSLAGGWCCWPRSGVPERRALKRMAPAERLDRSLRKGSAW